MATNHDINEVVAETLDVLKRGGLILYPTDTVWGIGCDATNETAVQKVFALKRRAEAKSLVLLACDLDMVARYIRKIPSIAVDLVSVNDAPMTIVYPDAVVQRAAGKGQYPSPAAFGLAPSVVAADGSVGIRIPRADSTGIDSKGADWDERPVSAGAVFCNRLIYRLRRPLVSTSANISGEPAPASFAEISPEIIAGVDYVVPAAVSGLALPGLSRSGSPSPASRSGSGQAPSAATVRFDDSASGRPSQILKLGLDGEVEIIRP